MKILFVSNVFPSPWRPIKGTFNLELVRALAREHQVRVVAPLSWVEEWKARREAGLPPGAPRQARPGGVEVHYPRYYYTPKLLRRFYGWFLWQSVRGTVRRLLAAERPDVVLGYWAHPDGAVAVRIARSVGIPAVVMVGGSDVLVLARERGRRHCVVRTLQAADAVVTASQDLKEKLAEFGVPPGKVHVAYRGVDVGRFFPGDRAEARRRLGIPAEGPALLWVGRMVPVKGLDVLLEACAGLRGRCPAFRLYLVGDGPLRRPLKEEARSRGLSEVVSFVGPVLQDRLPDWYRAADVTVLPSRSEGVPNVLRESLACGTRFVASRVGGIPEIAQGAHNRLVPPNDPAALADGILGALRDDSAAAPPAGRVTGWVESAEALLRILRPLTPAQAGLAAGN